MHISWPKLKFKLYLYTTAGGIKSGGGKITVAGAIRFVRESFAHQTKPPDSGKKKHKHTYPNRNTTAGMRPHIGHWLCLPSERIENGQSDPRKKRKYSMLEINCAWANEWCVCFWCDAPKCLPIACVRPERSPTTCPDKSLFPLFSAVCTAACGRTVNEKAFYFSFAYANERQL